MAKPCRVVVSPQLAEVLNLEPNQDLSYREWVQILHDGGLDKLADRALVALGEVKKGAKESVELQNELEVREQRSMNEPRDAKDVAIIFRKLFNFSPFEAVAAARIFDAKAARMSKLLGISKEDYYKRYWFTSEQEGGLSQLTKQSKENNLALGVSGKGFLTPNQIQSLTKEIESQYAKNVGETLMREKDDIRTNMFDYDNPIASKTVNGVDLRIAEGLIRDGKKTYLLYANGGIIGEFNSAADAKTAVKFVEDRLVKNKQLSQTEVTEEQINKTESALKNVDLKNIIGQKIFRGQQKGMKGRWFTSSKKFAEVFANSIRGKGKVEPEIIEQTILGRVLDFPFNVTDYAKISDKLADIFGVTQQEIRDALSKTQDSLGKGDVIRIHTLLEDENFGNLLASKGIDYVKAKENLTKTEAVDTFLNVSGKTQERLIAEAYHRAKVENNNTELVKSVESLIGKQEGLSLFQTDRKESLSQMTLPDGREVTVKRMSPEVVNGFYSPIEKNLMEYGKDKIKAKDWLNVVGKGDEAVFTGVRAFLEGKDPNAMVSKQEILDYMKDNRISVVEVVKGSLSENEQAQKLYNRPYSELTDIEQMVVDGAVAKSENGTTKFSQYQLEGEKENYKEVLVTLPRGETEEGLPKGWKVIPKEEYKDAWSGSSNYLVIDEDGFSVIGGDTRKDAINAYKKFKPRTNIKDTKFQSTHFSEPDILVHLRMNTRTDADGKKVLFLEEVQSDWGQTGKKEGFKQDFDKNKVSIEWTPEYGTNVKGEKYPLKNSFTILYDGSPISGKIGGYYETNQDALNYAIKIAEKDFEKRKETKTPTAPFVMDTNAWTKLGLKVALKEAVKQGADKIAWTTGTQQFDRWGTEKIDWVKTNKGWTINIQEQFSGTAFEGMNVDEKALSEKGTTITSKEDLKAAIYRTLSREKNEAERQKLTDRIWDRMQKEDSGTSLPRKEGMESFYGTEGTKGIVGGVAEKLFGQKVGETKIGSKATYTTDDTYVATDGKAQKLYSKVGDKFLASISNETANGFSSKDLHIELVYLANKYSKQNVTISTQPSVDITPELKAQVQEGLPLFQGDRKGAWSKEAAKAKRIISMYQKADSTTQAHEVVGHDFLDEIIQLSSTNEEMAEDLNTIVDEFIKETGSKVSKEKLLKDLKDFDVEKKQNQNGKDIHEWFAESAERYFATERGAREGAGFSKKMVALFEKFRQYMADLYSKMNKELVEPSPAMKQIFRKIFGAENFAEAEEMRKATFDRMNSLQASELEMNYSKSKPKLSDIINKYKPKEGLGQLSDDFVQDMYNAASIIVKDGEATRWNVTNKLQELMPHLKSEIEQLRKVLQEVGTKGNLRGGVENLLANPYITDEIKEKIAKLSEYTPESMAKVGLNAEQILSYYIGEADNNDIVGMQTVAKLLAEGKFDGFTEKVSLRQLLIANYNQLAKITKDENKRIDYVNAAVDQAEAYAIEGTGMGRMINMYKALGSLTADGLIVWAKRQEMKFTKPSFERFKSEIKDLKKRLKKAQEDIDYFFEQVVGREETEAQYKEVIAAYQAEIDALKSRKPKEPKASKSAYRNVKKQRQFNDSDLSELAKEVLASKLFQDMSNLTPAQKLAYAIMERKPTNISELAKQFSKYLGKKVDPSELRELYQQTRDFLITQDIGYAEGLSANEELEKDLQDLEDTKRAKIEELERKKAAAEAELAEKKAKKEGKAQDPADKLSNFVLSDLKRAMSGTLPKQKTYVEELLSALTQKAKEVALKGEKGTQKQAPITPIEAIKKALDAIQNGRPDASIWNDAVEQVKQKIEQDPDLSQQDKEDLNLYLNDYTSFVYDNMLNDSVILKAIKENLIANGYGSGNTVNFKALIVADGQAQMQERQRLIEKLKQDLSQYDPVQVEKVLDAIAERYQRLINEKRKQIADEYINQTFKTKSPSTRRAIRGTIGKLIMENRMGLFDDTNNAILDALAEKKGFTNMTSDDWAKIKEYADLVEALPLDSNLQNEALEEMTAFVRTKMPGRWLLIATAVRYGVLLGRITSNIKNAVGGFEQALTLTLARAMRGDTEFGKSALKGFGQGDFKDVLIGGGINQANRISVEADANGMPRFRVLEYLKPKTIGGKVVESVKYSGRMLDAMDAIWQKFFTSGYDIKYMRKLLQLENPNATKQEIDDMVNKIFSNDRIADYMDQATKEVIASGKKVTEAKVRRRAYEIMRDSLVRPIAKQLSDFESTEKTYKTDFLENFGVGTGVGAIALATANVSKKLIEPLVERIVKMKTKGVSDEYAKEQAKIYSSIIPNFILPFSKGLSGFIEKGLERELIYGLTKSIAVSIAAKSKNPTTIEEKMAQYRAIEKAKDIATSAVVTNLILYGVGGILYAMSKQWEDDEEKEGRYHPKTGVYGKAKPMTIKGVTVKEKAEPENVIVLFGEEIPLSYVGGLGVTAMVDANLYKAFTEETDERKKTKAMEVASNFGTASLYTMDSFLSQAWLMQASDNKSITEMIKEGNTERALNLIQNTMINYMGSYIPWSGFINQSLQGARELSGGETYQEAKTISEKIQKQFGLAGITYTNTKKNYLGEDIKYSDVNKEGIIGLVNMFKTKSISAEDNWLRNIGFKEKASGQYAKGLKDLDGYSPSIEEYDRYDDRTKSMFGIIAKEAYNQKANIVPLPNEINRVTKKPYTVDEFQSKVMRSALSAVSKYNIVRLKKERGDYNSDKDAYEQDMENAFYNLDEVADIIYYKKGDEYKNRKRKKDALIDKVTEIK